MNLPKEIKSDIWVKNWSGNWRMTFASLYGCYTTGLKFYTGKNLSTNLIVSEKDSSSNYISKKDLDSYGFYIANLIIQENNLANKWVDDTIITAQELLKVLAKLKKPDELTLNNLLELKQKFYIHIPPHFSMKKVVDYLPEKLQKKLFPKLVKARVKTENLFNNVDAKLRFFTKNIALRTHYPTTLTEFLTIEEVEDYLKNKITPSQNELIKRHKGVAVFYKGHNQTILSGLNYKQLQKVLVDKTSKEFKGVVAFKGVVRGRVRIVFDPFKVENFKRGDILITGMTRPEFLPLMKVAGAFVTDAGGLLSHAAIVARELKKPCILSTETATKVFKDGDLVEVDANMGVVRKL